MAAAPDARGAHLLVEQRGRSSRKNSSVDRGIEIDLLAAAHGLEQAHGRGQHDAERDRHVHVEAAGRQRLPRRSGRTAGRHRRSAGSAISAESQWNSVCTDGSMSPPAPDHTETDSSMMFVGGEAGNAEPPHQVGVARAHAARRVGDGDLGGREARRRPAHRSALRPRRAGARRRDRHPPRRRDWRARCATPGIASSAVLDRAHAGAAVHVLDGQRDGHRSRAPRRAPRAAAHAAAGGSAPSVWLGLQPQPPPRTIDDVRRRRPVPSPHRAWRCRPRLELRRNARPRIAPAPSAPSSKREVLA